jgi:hypothetical protein
LYENGGVGKKNRAKNTKSSLMRVEHNIRQGYSKEKLEIYLNKPKRTLYRILPEETDVMRREM